MLRLVQPWGAFCTAPLLRRYYYDDANSIDLFVIPAGIDGLYSSNRAL
jgi:hypothetical protein